MTQRPIAVRLPEETIDGLDQLVSEGWYVTRSEGIKDALDKLLELFERKKIDDALIAGYERMPLTEDELRLLDAHAGMAAEVLDDEEW